MGQPEWFTREHDEFPVEIAIRQAADGEVRTYRSREWRHKTEGWSDFCWAEGNFSCDCNRGDFFIRASGREPTDEESEANGCGDEAYAIDYIKDLETGEIIYTESDSDTRPKAGDAND